jgi:hypothetical protein
MLTVWTLLIFTATGLPSTTIFRSPETCQAALREAVQHISDATTAMCVESVVPAGLAMRRRG